MSIPKLLCALAAGAALFIAGCSGGSGSNAGGGNEAGGSTATTSSGQKLKVGFSQLGHESDWRNAETASVQEEAKARGADLKLNDANNKQEDQITALRSFIAQKVDVIFLAPKVETGWEPILKEAQRAKIPVVLLDRGVKVSDESLYATLLSSDFVEEGRRAGEWLAKKMDGKANIVELQGTVGSAPANDRKAGFAEGISKFPGMKISASQSGDFTLAQGKQVMEAFLKADPNIQAVFAHNDDMALGAIQAIEEAGKKPGVDIIVVSIDGVKRALEAIVAGKLNCSVECNPLLGPGAFDAAEKLVKGESVEKKVISKEELFDSTNAKEALPNRKY